MRKATSWRGYPATGLIRAMTAWGWTTSQVTKAFEKLQISISPVTIESSRQRYLGGTKDCLYISEPARAELSTLTGWPTNIVVKFKPHDPERRGPNRRRYHDEETEEVLPDYSSPAETPVVLPSATDDFENFRKNILRTLELMTAKVDGLDAVQLEHHSTLKEYEEQFKTLEELALTVGGGSRTIKVKLPTGETNEIEGIPHPALDKVVKMVQGAVINRERRRLHVYLVGPAGSGKSYLAEQVAEVLGLQFAMISCSIGMSEAQLLGRMLPVQGSPAWIKKRYKQLKASGLPDSIIAAIIGNGAFRYVRSDFVKCYEEGGVFLFDEVDRSDANTLTVIHAALAGKRVFLPNRPNKPAVRHKDFACICAANTMGGGADRLYTSATELDEAFKDRFRMGRVIMNYDPALEASVCPDADLRLRLQKYRKAAEPLRRVISMRFMRDAYLAKVIGMSDKDIDDALMADWREDEKAKVKGAA